ncbi:hypothetical protein JAAARDRAFT_61776 [Jaapia argillacea MUCL 33604]|uniref:MARVEL domain-containing protein n=1 Tax=Jaapia argillacea MUCL 33604 TaxID=933084 RepID=A0A067PDA4_9AGAM|nr:hypothetical protein JAAARDRAFT_61776 [Jaapia argillacea MUCL 33604]
MPRAQAITTPPGRLNSNAEEASRTASIIITTIILLVGIIYVGAVAWFYRRIRSYPRPLNKTSGVQLQKFAPAFYALLTAFSLVEISLSTWLLSQYHINMNYPSMGILTGVRVVLFSACWTLATATGFMFLFLHPTWSKHPIASVGSQGLWIVMTWGFWVAGTGILNTNAPALFQGGTCIGLVYCGQLQTLFAFSILQIVAFMIGLSAILWVVWKSTQVL